MRWSLAMNTYLTEKGYHDMKALVAFSGKITSRKVVVLETGKVTGTLDAGQLVVREGAVLNGPVAAGKSASGAPAAASGSAAPAPATAPAAKS